MMEAVYLDHAATTPLDPRVRDAMKAAGDGIYANPSSMHLPGRKARDLVDRARHQVAELLNAKDDEIVFTSSGTEADNWVLRGVAEQWPGACHIITSAIEHPAILETCRFLEGQGVAVTYLPVDEQGLVIPSALNKALRSDTRLVSIMAANNVVGTLQPIDELSHIAQARGVWFHTDAVQTAGKIPVDLQRQKAITFLSLSSHKIYGPKGCGALFIRSGSNLPPLIHGGGQEKGRRSSTENIEGIVGFGAAAGIARLEMKDETLRLVRMRDDLLAELRRRIPGLYLIGHPYRRLPGHLCVGVAGRESEAIKLMLAMDEAGIAISSGSACSASHADKPSYILQAMGFDPVRARGGLRITLGRFNTTDEIDHFLGVTVQVVKQLGQRTTTTIKMEDKQ
jgi:cysteine desulfurase